jgi:hypothetical protein
MILPFHNFCLLISLNHPALGIGCSCLVRDLLLQSWVSGVIDSWIEVGAIIGVGPLFLATLGSLPALSFVSEDFFSQEKRSIAFFRFHIPDCPSLYN